jgi:DNA-binding NarL/FixJ family response regulator
MDQPVRIVIADDQPRACQGLQALLATWPEIEIVGKAANGQEAIQLVEQCQPDVVLMDMRMPVMDGLEATHLIKARWPQVKVVALTMYATYRADALTAGADVFLLKGCPVNDLLNAVEETRRRKC